MTASGGVATFSGLTLNKVGSGYTLQASSSDLTSATTTGITVTPASATQLAILAGGEPPASVDAGQSFPMVVDAEDQFGNLATSFNGSVTIALANKSRQLDAADSPSMRSTAWQRFQPGDRHGRDLPARGHQQRTDLGHVSSA